MLLISKGIPFILHCKEGAITYQDDLLCYLCTVNLSSGILPKMAIADESKELPILLIIDRDDEREVCVVDTEQLIGLQGTHVEVDLLYPLAKPLHNLHVLNVVSLIGREHHRWHVVYVSLLCDASVHTNVALAKRVHLELNLEFACSRNILELRMMKKESLLF